MITIVFLLIIPAFVVSVIGTYFAKRLGVRLGSLDSPGSEGHVKIEIRCVPNIGGIAIVAGILLPIIAGMVFFFGVSDSANLSGSAIWSLLSEHIEGIHERLPMIASLVGCVLGLHVLGLVDDRRPLGPWPKLVVQAIASLVMIVFFDTRLLTMLDGVAGLGILAPWLSVVITLLWFLVVTNAINFMDNMDGLAAGVGAIASGLFLVAACLNEQWFIAATLALLFGSLVGFLIFNFPPASIFMGDGGSLVIGYLLAFLTTRTTYYNGSDAGGVWYGVLMPVVILAVPLYDLISVSVIRIRQGKSPLVGDQQHFSHRFVMRGFSVKAAVLMIWGCTLATGLGGVMLSRLESWQAVLVGVQTIVILGFIAIYEREALRSVERRRSEHGVDLNKEPNT